MLNDDKGKVYPLRVIPIINLNLIVFTFITTICCIINTRIAIHFSIGSLAKYSAKHMAKGIAEEKNTPININVSEFL